MLARTLARGPVADDLPEVPPPDRHVAEDPLDPLAGPRRARARSPEDLALHSLPRERQRLARDHVQAQILLACEGDPVLDASAARLVPLLGDLEQDRLRRANPPDRQPVPALVVGILAAGDDRRPLRLAGAEELLVLVERALRGADHDRGQGSL